MRSGENTIQRKRNKASANIRRSIMLTGLPIGFVDDLPQEEKQVISQAIENPSFWMAMLVMEECGSELRMPRK
jgi:hypothetical protein